MGSGNCCGFHMNSVRPVSVGSNLSLCSGNNLCFSSPDLHQVEEMERRKFIRQFKSNLKHLYRLYHYFKRRKLFDLNWEKNAELCDVQNDLIVMTQKKQIFSKNHFAFLIIIHVLTPIEKIELYLIENLFSLGVFDFIQKNVNMDVVSNVLKNLNKQIVFLGVDYKEIAVLEMKRVSMLYLTGYKNFPEDGIKMFPINTQNHYKQVPLEDEYTRDITVLNTSGVVLVPVESGTMMLKQMMFEFKTELPKNMQKSLIEKFKESIIETKLFLEKRESKMSHKSKTSKTSNKSKVSQKSKGEEIKK